MLKLNFYSKIIKNINEFHNKNEYIDQVSQLIYYNEIRKEAIFKFVKFHLSDEVLDKIDSEVQNVLLLKPTNYPTDELNNVRKTKIQQYATKNIDKITVEDIYIKYFEENEIITSEIIHEDILFDIASISL